MASHLRVLGGFVGMFVFGLAVTPAAAGPLALFSRTANSAASDGIGVDPAPLQAVNNVDRTGLVQTLLTDGDFSAGNVALAFANVEFGHIRLIAFTAGA